MASAQGGTIEAECHVFAMRGLEVAARGHAQSTSTRLKTLGMVGVPYKRLETLSVLTIDSSVSKLAELQPNTLFPH